jgi:hypothetical protein
MLVKDFIQQLKDNLNPDAEIDFLLNSTLDSDERILAFLHVHSIGMNADIDDPDNVNRGGIVFDIKDLLLRV